MPHASATRQRQSEPIAQPHHKSPYESGLHTDEQTRSISVTAAEGDCVAPPDAAESVNFDELGCGCSSRTDAALPNLLLLAFIFLLGGFLMHRSQRRRD